MRPYAARCPRDSAWYKYGKLGVVEEGAYADLVVVDGNPLENIEVLNEYKEKFKLVMKDGEVHKNTLE